MLALAAPGDVYRSRGETLAKPRWLPLLPLPKTAPLQVEIPTSGVIATPAHTLDVEPTRLLDLLCNSLILNNIVPHLPIDALLNLSATSRLVRYLILHTPGVFRHLDLTIVPSARFRLNGPGHVQRDSGGDGSVFWFLNQADIGEDLTEDDFYSGPLNAVFAKLAHRSLLSHVQTLVLDGLSVTSERCHEILTSDAFSVRILSIRNVGNLNQNKLRQSLQYICRPSRPEGTPRLKGLYIFGNCDDYPTRMAPFHEFATKNTRRLGLAAGATGGHLRPRRAPIAAPTHDDADPWWNHRGKVLPRAINEEWAQTMLACHGIIAFDAVLCQSPNHHSSPAYRHDAHGSNFRPPSLAVATMSVSGCFQCGRAPEGMTRWSYDDAYKLPLLAPVPIFGSTIHAATRPRHAEMTFAARCTDCLHRRYCWGCNKWWCEDCYHGPSDDPHHKPPVSRDCWECGNNCGDCTKRTQAVCSNCKMDYCTLHSNTPPGLPANTCQRCASSRTILTKSPITAGRAWLQSPRVLMRRGIDT